jgi:hypothetical protein
MSSYSNEKAPEPDWSGAFCGSSGGRIRTADLWVMSRPRVVSPGPTGCIRDGRYDCRHLCCPMLSQQTHSVARRLVTTAVTKHGPYSPGLPRPWSATEARTLRLTDAGKSGIGPRNVGVQRSPGSVRVQHGAARCGQNCGHLVTLRRPT